MSWNEDKSTERVKARDISENEIVVAKLSKEMNFDNLGVHDVRRAEGAHFYVDVPNFHEAVADASADKQKLARLVRAASVLRKVQAKLLEVDEIQPLQLQTARLHAIAFKPYDSSAERALAATIASITLNTYIYEVFNPAFEEIRNLRSAAGIDAGESLICNIGRRGDRELLSLGTCANTAAKILNGSGTVTVTSRVYEELPAELADHFTKATIRGIEVYRASGIRWTTHPELAEALGVSFDVEYWQELTEEYRNALPLVEIEISGAVERIDPENLTERKSKKVPAATVCADLDGFTRFVEEAEREGDDSVKRLVRFFHGVRNEFHDVIAVDFDGVVIQHRGDCVVAILHMPAGEESDKKRATRAVEIAVALQSSMVVLNDYYADFPDIQVAVGLAYGGTLVSRIGKKGERENICLGKGVEAAEDLQVSCKGKEIRLSDRVYELLEEGALKDQFRKNDDGSYSALGLTFSVLEDKEIVRAARNGKLFARPSESGPLIVVGSGREPQRHVNTPAWRR